MFKCLSNLTEFLKVIRTESYYIIIISLTPLLGTFCEYDIYQTAFSNQNATPKCP